MQIEALKIFCDVVRFRSFSRCAEINHVSQPTASQAVHHLEERLGVRLIDRSKRPWKLTDQGRFFYRRCRELVDGYYELEAEVKSFHEEETVPLVRVACIYSVGLRHMNRYAERFEKLYPHARIHTEYLHPDQVYEKVLNEEIDCGIISFPHQRRDLSVIPWRQEEMVLACSPEHPLAGKKEIPWKALDGEKFVGFDRGLVIRREKDRFLKQQGVHVEMVLEFDNIEAIKRAVEINSGVALLPRPTLDREVAQGSLVAVPLSGPSFVRPLGIIHSKGKKFRANVSHFIELLQREEEPAPALASAKK